MSEMIMRAAKAIDEADEDELLLPLIFGVQQIFARAVIGTLHNPTQEMIAAGRERLLIETQEMIAADYELIDGKRRGDAKNIIEDLDVKKIFQAMIKEALK